ncbi:phage T7 F exclusion suppressor FxsA [Falsiruegeria litorea R37]|uniref:Phage T7 F exclusion suppressor FxsA n=1 Tax=Falsiruegeria litorea R37 TaxID=1200284 RepID=A0A1Y5TVD7_9RHOB|nr:FxsA family protein [Falsiruegeria litorea]SLN69323.1 phage T7 F exclusion suppressor FxsA [Falsiruegeria litorea R37]
MYLFLAFLLVPIIEIALFIQVGGLIGLWPTLAIVVLTAVLGTWLVRTQGRMAMGQLQQAFSTLDDPTEPLAHGAMILFSGALLLTPGFFTDAVGFALLVPGVRVAVFRYLRSKVTVSSFQMGGDPRFQNMHSGFDPRQGTRHPGGPGDIIDGEYEEVGKPRDPNAPPSGWVEGPDRH